MKKFISLAMALAMTVALVPATALAATDARISNTVTAKEDTVLVKNAGVGEIEAPIFELKADGEFIKDGVQEFRVNLENAEWQYDKTGAATDYIDAAGAVKFAAGSKIGGATAKEDAALGNLGDYSVTVTKISAKSALVKVETNGVIGDEARLQIPMLVELTGGVATVSVDGLSSEFSDETKTFAKTSEGSTSSYIEETSNFYDGNEIKDFFIEENVAGTIKAKSEIKLKVSGGFKFNNKAAGKDIVIEQVKGDKMFDSKPDATVAGDKYIKWDGANTVKDGITSVDVDDDEITITLDVAADSKAKSAGIVPSTSKTALLAIRGLAISEDGASNGDVAKITVSGDSGISRETIEVGTMVDYGVTMKAESKELPVIYAGSLPSSTSDNETLKFEIKETVKDSLIKGRKLKLVMPDGVEVIGHSVDKGGDIYTVNTDGDEVTLDSSVFDNDKKETYKLSLDIATEADFTGDVEVTLTGAAMGKDELKATIATVKAPIEVKTAINEVAIDYRNTAINDITIVEPEAGAWKKGDKILLAMKDEYIDFEDGAKAEVVKGDMKLEDIDVKDGTITLEVKSTSSKDAAEIKISGLELYLGRQLAAGDYALKVQGICNVGEDGKITNKGNKSFLNNYLVTDSAAGVFDTNGITVLKDFVKVVTAGRDMDNSFTTKITVPVGADKILAGTKEIAVDAAAYINKDGYTMLPVRAVTEALNGLAIVRWDDATKTATISFGSRVFSMTVGSKTMNMNGVPTNLLAAPEIKNSRIFLPLRDLGYALGLTDSKITWDAATSTATLN